LVVESLHGLATRELSITQYFALEGAGSLLVEFQQEFGLAEVQQYSFFDYQTFAGHETPPSAYNLFSCGHFKTGSTSTSKGFLRAFDIYTPFQLVYYRFRLEGTEQRCVGMSSQSVADVLDPWEFTGYLLFYSLTNNLFSIISYDQINR